MIEHQADAVGYHLIAPPIPGGSACVYKAKHLVSDKIVALKVLHAGQDSSRLHREAKALSRLHHPNIVQLHELGKINDSAFLATRWIEGKTLKQVIETAHTSTESMQLSRVLHIARQIAHALQHAHDCGVVHGDLGPANILVSDTDHATIIDFGIGRLAENSTLTATSDLAGTPRYLAPEVIRGASPTNASDQYALALLIYEMLTGRWPFDHSPTAATSLHHQLYSSPTSLREVVPQIPQHIDNAVIKALNKSPGSRHDCLNTFLYQLSAVPPSSSKYAKSLQHAGIAALATLLFASGWWLMTSDQVAQSVHADDAVCNLYGNAGLNDELEQNFYRDVNNDYMAARVDKEELTTSPVLQLGKKDVYGMYGVILKIDPTRRYRFEADLWFEDYVHQAQLVVLWLDNDWLEIKGTEQRLNIQDKFDDQYVIEAMVPPDNARYAVPTVFKDASKGVVFADNIVFAPEDGNCE